MKKNLYEEKILEYLRHIHFTEKVLYDILKDVKALRKEKNNGEDDTCNG